MQNYLLVFPEQANRREISTKFLPMSGAIKKYHMIVKLSIMLVLLNIMVDSSELPGLKAAETINVCLSFPFKQIFVNPELVSLFNKSNHTVHVESYGTI